MVELNTSFSLLTTKFLSFPNILCCFVPNYSESEASLIPQKCEFFLCFLTLNLEKFSVNCMPKAIKWLFFSDEMNFRMKENY